MKDTNVWINSGFIGHQLLTSNLKDLCHQLVFLGAEEMKEVNQYRINFMMSQQFTRESDLLKIPMGGCSVSFSLLVSKDEELRFERFLGIYREITVEYAPEDFGLCKRFLLAQSIKFLQIEKDFIKYEIFFY